MAIAEFSSYLSYQELRKLTLILSNIQGSKWLDCGSPLHESSMYETRYGNIMTRGCRFWEEAKHNYVENRFHDTLISAK